MYNNNKIINSSAYLKLKVQWWTENCEWNSNSLYFLFISVLINFNSFFVFLKLFLGTRVFIFKFNNFFFYNFQKFDYFVNFLLLIINDFFDNFRGWNSSYFFKWSYLVFKRSVFYFYIWFDHDNTIVWNNCGSCWEIWIEWKVYYILFVTLSCKVCCTRCFKNINKMTT